ncbi:MAG: glycosyltransferase [Cetobacterium sp.]
MKKNICMFVWNNFTNDARVLRECTALNEEGYNIKLVAIHDYYNKKLLKREKKGNFEIVRVERFPKFIKSLLDFKENYNKKIKSNKYIFLSPFLLITFSIIFFLKISKILKYIIITNIFIQMIRQGIDRNYDVYHSNDLNTLPQGWICAKILKKNAKLIYDSHEVQTSRTGYKGKKYYYLEKFLIKKVDRMIMTTKTRVDYTRKLYGIESEIVHNYPFYNDEVKLKDTTNIYQKLDLSNDEPILLYQGGIQEGRGLENIIKASLKFKRGVVVFIGDGKIKPKLQRMVNENSLGERIKFLDKVPVEELSYYTSQAYLGFQVLQNVCFNHYSALSNKLFEYIMSEVPIVACDFPEIKKIVEKEKVGISINASNPDNIASAVNYILDNPKIREEMSKRCKEAKKIYNWKNEKKVFISIYKGELKNEF